MVVVWTLDKDPFEAPLLEAMFILLVASVLSVSSEGHGDSLHAAQEHVS